jgi:hypothetical protein
VSGWGDIFCCCEKGVNASERVQRTVGALVVVVAPVSWDCCSVAERRVERPEN